MTTLEIIKEICREHGTTISSLEKALNYGNGALTKATQLPFYRITEIANYFHVPVDYFVPTEDGNILIEEDATEERLQRLRALEYYNRYLQAPQRIRDAVDMLLTEDQHTV